jgi:uncharacterized protein (TIGR00255 family)
MVKSMTGYSKAEAEEQGITALIELKSLNGKNLEISVRLPKSLSHKEIEVRDLIKPNIARGTVSLNIFIEKNEELQAVAFNESIAEKCFDTLSQFRKKMKIKEPILMEHVLRFSDVFSQPQPEDTSDNEWKAVKKALKIALTALNKMRANEGSQISKDMLERMKKISATVDKVEALGMKKIPEERERLRQKVAQLFESDEIDEHRLQMELVLIADKLDISEECVRLRSHIKFFFDAFKLQEPIGRKMNFLLQEMNREVNTIGSKANDIEISHSVVAMKEELERIREQIQNIE